MTDTSSSGNVPSPVVCPLAKLGGLSPSPSTPDGGARGLVYSSGSPPLPIRSRRCFKSTSTSSSSSIVTTTTTMTTSRESRLRMAFPSQYRYSDASCDGITVTLPTYRYQQQLHQPEFGYQSPTLRNLYRTDDDDDDDDRHRHHHRNNNNNTNNNNNNNSNNNNNNSNNNNNNITPAKYIQTTTTTSNTKTSLGSSSPYLDQGYHTLAPPSPLGRFEPTVITKYQKKAHQPKCCHFERLPDVVILHVLSWLSTNELCQVSKVCRRWYNLAWDQTLWKTITLHGEGTCADKAANSILRRLCGQAHNGYCSGVKQLFVYDGAKITDKGLSSFSRRCPELTRVQMQNCPALTDSSISELVTRCLRIQHLDLTGCSLISCISLIPGFELPQKLLLQHLDLTDCTSVQDSSLRIILRNCPQLTFLYLRRCSRITDAGVKFVPSFCSSLRELSVSDCHLVTDFALYELAKLGSNLRYLSVAKCGQVSDVGLKVIAKRCYKLRYLNVRGCEAVSDDALTAVAHSCPRLRALDIGKCDVSDAGLKVLAENCPNLKKLSLRNCDLVTDRGVQYVCYYCRGLQQLNIQDCQISLEGYKAVRRYCKRCIIEHTNPGFF